MGFTPEPSVPGFTRQAFLRRAAGTAGGVVGVSSLAAFMAACGDSETTGGDDQGTAPARATGLLRVAIADYPQSLDPTVQTSVAELSIMNNVYESLVAFNEDYSELVPALATRWEALDNARTWRFTLRPDVRFHDGAVFDSTAVRKNYEYVLRRTNPYAFLLGTPSKIDDSEPGVVVIRYDKPFPDLAHNLTFARSMASPAAIAGGEEAMAKLQAGTGPFRFTTAQDGQSVGAEAFAGYWGDRAHIEKLEFVKIPEESARVSALQAGDVDLVMQVAPLAARSLASDTRLKVHEAATWTTVYLMTVYDQEPFDDPRVRQAMAHAIDRKSLVEKVLMGDAVLDDSMFPPGIPGYAVPETTYAYDPEKARALLQEVSPGGKIPVRLSTRADTVLASEISQALAAQLNAVGFEASAEVLDIAVFEGDKGLEQPKYQLHWGEWGWITGGPFHLALGALAAQCHYSTNEFDRLVAKVNATANGPEREQAIKEAIDVSARDLPWLTLWVPKRLDASVGGLAGYQVPPNVSTRLGSAYLAS